MAEHPLVVDNVCKSFKSKEVLYNVSLDVEPGQIYGLIGLNGAGKTTMIKIILGLLNQDSGSVTLFGQDARKIETRKNFCFLPEKFQPSPFLKGHEFLSLALSYYGKKYNKAEGRAGAAKLDLDPDVLSSKITKYSKGMGQKLGLLSAFMTNAPLLILDEPMSGLDPSARIALKEMLLDYVKRGNTIFFSSHILSDIDEICDNIAVLDKSHIIYTGEPAAFKKQYDQKNLERAFLQAIAA